MTVADLLDILLGKDVARDLPVLVRHYGQEAEWELLDASGTLAGNDAKIVLQLGKAR